MARSQSRERARRSDGGESDWREEEAGEACGSRHRQGRRGSGRSAGVAPKRRGAAATTAAKAGGQGTAGKVHFSAERLSLKALPVELPDTRISVSIITVRRRTLSPLAELFIRCAREVAKPLS